MVSLPQFLQIENQSELASNLGGLETKDSMSISYLFSIRDDEGNYLLIKGNRIQQYQPIGGVYKYFKSFQPIKSKLEVTDEINKNFYDPDDLRIYLPGKNLYEINRVV